MDCSAWNLQSIWQSKAVARFFILFVNGTYLNHDCSQTGVMKIRVQKRRSHYGKYRTIILTVPKDILGKARWLRKQRVVEIEVDVLGHITIKP